LDLLLRFGFRAMWQAALVGAIVVALYIYRANGIDRTEQKPLGPFHLGVASLW